MEHKVMAYRYLMNRINVLPMQDTNKRPHTIKSMGSTAHTNIPTTSTIHQTKTHLRIPLTTSTDTENESKN
jgi:hypothetical protein